MWSELTDNEQTANKRPRMGASWSDDEALDDDESSSDNVKDEEDEDEDNDVKGLTSGGKNPVSTTLPNWSSQILTPFEGQQEARGQAQAWRTMCPRREHGPQQCSCWPP